MVLWGPVKGADLLKEVQGNFPRRWCMSGSEEWSSKAQGYLELWKRRDRAYGWKEGRAREVAEGTYLICASKWYAQTAGIGRCQSRNGGCLSRLFLESGWPGADRAEKSLRGCPGEL